MLHVAYNWSPFNFILARTTLQERWPGLTQIPFYGYYLNPELQAVSDFLLKFTMAVPIGISAWLVFIRPHPHFRRLRVINLGIVTVAFFFCVEVGQLFLPSRYPDITDVLIALLGFAAGLAASRLLPHSS